MDSSFLIRILINAESKIGPAMNKAAAQIDAFEKKVAGLQRRLVELNAQHVNIKVDADTGAAEAKLAALDAEADRVGGKHRSISFGVDDGAGLQRQLAGIGDAADDVADALDGAAQSGESAGGSFSSMGGSLGASAPLAAAAAVVLQQLASALVAVSGAAVAVGSAAGVAAAGIAGLATAAAAQAVPVVGLLAAAWSRVTAVQKVAQLGDQAQAKSSSAGVSADKARTAALATLASAHDAVANAQQQLVSAQESLTAARREGIRTLQDQVLAERSAMLAAQNSQAALDQAVASGSGNAIGGLQLQRDQDAVGASRQRTDTRSALAGGVEGLPAVQTAAAAVTSASAAIEKANAQVHTARQGLDEASSSMGAAADSYADALAKLSPAERKLLASIQRVKKTLSTTFRGITDPIVSGFAGALDRVDDLLRDPKILKSAKELAGAISDAIGDVAKFLTGPTMRSALEFFAGQASKNIGPVADMFESLVSIFASIARAASGELGTALQAVAGWLSDIADAAGSKGGQSALGKFFADAMRPIKAFLGLDGAVVELFAAVAGKGGAADAGTDGIERLTKSIQGATKWVDAHATEVREFFHEAIDATSAMLGAVFAIGKAIVAAFDGEQVKRVADLIADMAPVLKLVLGYIGGVVDVLAQLVGNKILDGALALAFQSIAGQIRGTLKSLHGVVDIINGLSSLDFGQVLKGFKELGSGIFERITAPLRVVGGKILDLLKSGFESIFPGAKDLGGRLVGWLSNGIKSGLDFFGELPGKIVDLLSNAVHEVGDQLESIGSRIVSALVRGIKKAPDAIIDAVGSLIPGPAKDGVKFAKNLFSHLAAGGPVEGAGTGTSDSIPAMLSNGEHVITAREVQAAGGHAAIFAMRRALGGGGQGSGGRFAAGGFVNGVGAHVDTTAERAIAAGLAKLGKALGITFSPVGSRSARRTAAENAAVDGAPNSAHLQGQAMDVAPDAIKTIANAVLNKYGINRPMPGTWTSPTGQVHDERNHITLLGSAASTVDAATTKVNTQISNAVDSVAQSYAQISRFKLQGGSSTLHDSLQATFDQMLGAANAVLKPKPVKTSLTDSATSTTDTSSVSDGDGSVTGNQVVGKKLAAAAGWVGSQWNALKQLWQGESGWDETIHNGGGHGYVGPNSAYGIPQALPGDKMASKGADWTTNPTTQISWGLDYIKSVYGSPENAFAKWMARSPHWYANGGAVLGSGVGDSVPAMLSPGEHVWTRNEVSAAGGHDAVTQLRKMATMLPGVGGDTDITGAVSAVTTFVSGLAKFTDGIKKGGAAFAAGIDGLFGDSGPFAAIETAITNASAAAARVVSDLQVKVTGKGARSTVTRAGGAAADPRVQGAIDISNLGTIRGQIQAEVDGIPAVLDELTAKLATTKNKGAREKIQAQINAVPKKLADLQTQLADNATSMLSMQEATQEAIADQSAGYFAKITTTLGRIGRIFAAKGNDQGGIDLFDAQVTTAQASLVKLKDQLKDAKATGNTALATKLQDEIDETNTTLEELPVAKAKAIAALVDKKIQARSDATDRTFKIGEIFGIVGTAQAKIAQQILNSTQAIADQTAALAAAEAAGNADDVKTIKDKIADLQSGIAQLTVDSLQANIDDINNAASNALGLNDVTQRLTALGITGGQAATGSYNLAALGRMDYSGQQQALQQRGGILTTQLAGLQGALGQAQAAGNVAAIQALTLQIAGLQADVVDNAKAIRDNTDAAFAYKVQQLQQTSDFKLALNTGAAAINDALGALAGVTDTATQTLLLQQRQATLTDRSKTDRGLLSELLGGLASSDLATLSGNALAKYLTENAPGWLDPNVFDDAQLDTIRTLTQAIEDDEKATLDNTKALADVSTSVAQTFSGAAWSMFRQAVTNGNGGLLTPYANSTVSAGQMAGMSTASLTAAGAASSTAGAATGDQTYITNITTPSEVLDPIYVGQKIALGISSVGRV
jgi:hypothetical protein